MNVGGHGTAANPAAAAATDEAYTGFSSFTARANVHTADRSISTRTGGPHGPHASSPPSSTDGDASLTPVSGRWAGQVAVVTGASSGIGRRIAHELRQQGAHVTGVARRHEGEVDRTCDVGDVDAFTALLDAVADEQGGRIDVLLNVAGADEPSSALDGSGDAVLDTYRRLLQTNYLGPVAGTLHVLPGMVERRHGIVVNTSSDSVRAPVAGIAPYAGSKGALSAFTESVAHEVWDTGVRVHVLYPGWVPTPMGVSGLDRGMPLPPKTARRTEGDIARLVLDRMGTDTIEINAVRVAPLAALGRAFFPKLYRRQIAKQQIPTHPAP